MSSSPASSAPENRWTSSGDRCREPERAGAIAGNLDRWHVGQTVHAAWVGNKRQQAGRAPERASGRLPALGGWRSHLG